MSVPANTISEKELRRLVPLSALSDKRFAVVSAELRVETGEPGTVLFRQGELALEWFYLLDGTVALKMENTEVGTIVGGSDESRIALAHQNPRKMTAVASSPIRFVRVRPDQVMEQAGGPLNNPGYEVQDGAESGEKSTDWMSALLQSPIFSRLPPANLQSLLRAIREISVRTGEVVGRQDQPGEFFQIVRAGQCIVTRQPRPGAKPVSLGTLSPWDSFGEDSIITGEPQSATVTMATDGSLLRLDKANFLNLILNPLIRHVDPAGAIALLNDDGMWLDLRLPDQAQELQLTRESKNVPFFSLKTMLPNLSRHRTYICVSEDGRLAAAAAFALLKARIHAAVLRGGIAALPEGEWVRLPKAAAGGSQAEQGPSFGSGEKSARRLQPGAEQLEPQGFGADLECQGVTMASVKSEQHQAENEASFPDRDRLAGRLDGAKPPRTEISTVRGDVHVELSLLRTRYLETQAAAAAAQREAAELRDYVAELKELTQNFLDEGERSVREATAAVHTELAMVREHAGAELLVLQKKLAVLEEENARLRQSLLALSQSQEHSGKTAPPAVSGEPTIPENVAAQSAGWVVAALLMLLLALLEVESSRNWLRRWYDHFPAAEQVQSTAPAQPAPPPLTSDAHALPASSD